MNEPDFDTIKDVDPARIEYSAVFTPELHAMGVLETLFSTISRAETVRILSWATQRWPLVGRIEGED